MGCCRRRWVGWVEGFGGRWCREASGSFARGWFGRGYWDRCRVGLGIRVGPAVPVRAVAVRPSSSGIDRMSVRVFRGSGESVQR